jgi:hypothetical protein
VHVCESRALNSGLYFARLLWRDGKVSRLRDLRLVWYGGAGHGTGMHRMGDGGWVKFTLQSAVRLLCSVSPCSAVLCVALRCVHPTLLYLALVCIALRCFVVRVSLYTLHSTSPPRLDRDIHICRRALISSAGVARSTMYSTLFQVSTLALSRGLDIKPSPSFLETSLNAEQGVMGWAR